jgi:CheY-like chemotaxis protein
VVKASVDRVTPELIRRGSQSQVLWVDDRPANNARERESLETLGVTFELAVSTEEALEKMASRRFDAIISDMGRPPDNRAGYTLLEKLRNRQDSTPFIIYAGSNAAEHKEEAKRRGAQGSTGSPSELFDLVTSLLAR